MRPQPPVGLRSIRTRLGISIRDVEKASKIIALRENNEDFAIYHATLVRIERGESLPGIHALLSLSAIYGQGLLRLYSGPESFAERHRDLGPRKTARVDSGPDGYARLPVPPPTAMPAPGLEKTAVLPPQPGAPPHQAWVRIGLADRTLYPVVRPGSFVLVDTRVVEVGRARYDDEMDRPIYLVETHTGSLCSWCERAGNRLIVLPHSRSLLPVRVFLYPGEAEVVGRAIKIISDLPNRLGLVAAPLARAAAAAR